MQTREFKPLPAWRRAALRQVLRKFIPALIMLLGIAAYGWRFGFESVLIPWSMMVCVVAAMAFTAVRRQRAEAFRIYLDSDSITFRSFGLADLRVRREEVKELIDRPGFGLTVVGEDGPLRGVPELFEGYHDIRAVLSSWRPIAVAKPQRPTWLNPLLRMGVLGMLYTTYSQARWVAVPAGVLALAGAAVAIFIIERSHDFLGTARTMTFYVPVAGAVGYRIWILTFGG